MIVMPANSTGWFWHCLARETGKLGHLYSPGDQRGPWPWLPFACDNRCFPLWNPEDNSFDETQWLTTTEPKWRQLLFWTQTNKQKPLWAIVPDRPGDWTETCRKWSQYAGIVAANEIPLAVAVQDGATAESVRELDPKPAVIAVGGSTEWKWETVEMWANEFPRVHLLRCNSPAKLLYLQNLGVESCDGTGWNRGDRKQTEGLENFCRGINGRSIFGNLAPYSCRGERNAQRQLKGQPVQEVFA